MLHKFHFSILLSIVSFFHINAQKIDTVLFSPRQLQEDFNALFRHLHHHHPDPYYYCGFEAFEKKKHEIYSQLDRPMTHDEFLMIIGTINSCLDEHSAVNVFTSSYLWRWIELVENSDSIIFPRVYVKDKRLYGDIKGKRTEILSINGVEASEVLNFMMQYWGNTTTRRLEYLLESYFAPWICSFFDIYPPYEVVYKTGKQTGKETLQGITYNEFKQFSPLFAMESLLYYKVYPSSSIAILTINTFSPDQLEKLGFDKTLEIFKDSIDRCNIQHLFIDVSKNGGGNGNGMVKLFTIIQHDTLSFNATSAYIPEINQYNSLYNPNHFELVSLPNKGAFCGELYVLHGTVTASSADFFCRIIDQHKLGVRVGNHSGDLIKNFSVKIGDVVLPNTKIGYRCSSMFIDFSREDTIMESLAPDMFWEIDNILDFTEEELKKIINEWNRQKNKKK